MYEGRPQIDIAAIAAQYGIDLTQPLTKENAEILNYAFMNNSSIPEGTVVRIQYDEKNNNFYLDVGIVTTVKLPAEEYMDISSEPSWIAAGIQEELGFPPSSPPKFNLHAIGEKAGLPYDEQNLLVENDDTGELSYYYAVSERHRYTLSGGATVGDALTDLNGQMSQDEFDYVTLQNGGYTTDLSYGEAYKERTGSSPTINNYPYGELHPEYELIGSYDRNNLGQISYNCFLTPEQNLAIKNNHIAGVIKENILKKYGYIEGLQVEIIDNKCYVYANNLYPTEFEFDPANPDIPSQLTASFNADMESGGKNSILFNLQAYINQNSTGDFLNSESIKIQVDADGNVYLITGDSKIPVSASDLRNYQSPNSLVNKIIEKNNIETGLRADGYEADVQMQIRDGVEQYVFTVNGKRKTYESVKNEDGTSSFREVIYDGHGNKTYGETKYSSLEEIYPTTDNTEDHHYYSQNKRLARRKNKSISDVDEETYNEMMENFKKVKLDEDIAPATDYAEVINKYDKTWDKTTLTKSATKITENLELLSKMIDAIVNLFILCDYDMKDVLDGILLGKDQSFSDWVFNLRHDETIDFEKEFQKQFTEKYNNYIAAVHEEIENILEFAKKGVQIDLTEGTPEYEFFERKLDEYNYHNGTAYTVKSLVHNGYMKAEDYSLIFGDEIAAMYSLEEGQDVDFSSFGYPNMEAFNNLVLYPTTLYMSGLSDYVNNYDAIATYRELDAYTGYVDKLFDPDYRRILKEIRENGSTTVTYKYYDGQETITNTSTLTVDGSFMTPAELAMNAYMINKSTETYLSQPPSSTFQNAIQFKINQRIGKSNAIKRMEDIVYGGYDNGDWWTQFFSGYGDGFIQTGVDLYHLFHHDNTVDQWTQHYVANYLSKTYDPMEIIESYRRGEISEEEYLLMAKLSGSEVFGKDNAKNKLSSATGRWLQNGYDIGNSFGDTCFQAGLSWMLGPLGKGPAAIIESGIKGLSKTGSVMNSTWNNMVLKETNAGFYINAFGQGTITGLVTWGTKKLKGMAEDHFKLSKGNTGSGTSSELNTDANLGSTENAGKSVTQKLLERMNKGRLKSLEAIPFYEFGNNVAEFGWGGAGTLFGIASGKKVVPELAKALANITIDDGYYYDLSTHQIVPVGNSGYTVNGVSLSGKAFNPLTGDLFDLSNLQAWANGDDDLFDLVACIADVGFDSFKESVKH